MSAKIWGKGEKMKKILFSIFLLVNCLAFAEEGLKGLFDFKELPVNKVQVEYGSLMPQYIKDSDYTDCWIFGTENIQSINTFLYYPYYANKKQGHESKIVINDQEFLFDGYLDVPFVGFLTFKYEKNAYLILTIPFGKYFDRQTYIFDITNPNKIVFYPPDHKFVEADFGETFIGVYNNKLCFFFAKNRFDWNLQCELSPYYIDGDSLKQLCDKKGNPYYINYSYNDRFEQELVIEDKYCK